MQFPLKEPLCREIRSKRCGQKGQTSSARKSNSGQCDDLHAPEFFYSLLVDLLWRNQQGYATPTLQ
jgi:hypothetical protein